MPSKRHQEDIQDLRRIRAAVRETSTLSSILADSWFERIESEILGEQPSTNIADPADFISELEIPGSIESLESRLSALRYLEHKQIAVEEKFNQLRATLATIGFRNHLFEASVLGDLVINGVLKDIDDETTGVDGVVDLAGRPILVEATNTTQEFRIESEYAMFVSIPREVNQVIHKVAKKVSDNRQIAKAGMSAVLFLALTRWGADPLSAAEAIDCCFREPGSEALSGVVLAASWMFRNTILYPARTPRNPLNRAELERMMEWYGATNGV